MARGDDASDATTGHGGSFYALDALPAAHQRGNRRQGSTPRSDTRKPAGASTPPSSRWTARAAGHAHAHGSRGLEHPPRENERWVPTFSDAQYVMSEKEWAFWSDLHRETP